MLARRIRPTPLLQLLINRGCDNATQSGIGGLVMSNGGRRNSKIESLSIDVPKKRWASAVFDLLYPSIAAVLGVSIALYAGYLEPGQLANILPRSLLGLFGIRF